MAPISARASSREGVSRPAVFTLMFLPLAAPVRAQHSPPGSEEARFEPCASAVRVTCVVDGDTCWYRGDKIRLADINAPEISRPACPREAGLGRAASSRLLSLLNEGPFTLVSGNDWRDRDRYGRLLRIVTRRGESLVRRWCGKGWPRHGGDAGAAGADGATVRGNVARSDFRLPERD